MPWLPTKSLCLCASQIFHDHIPGIFKDTFNLRAKLIFSQWVFLSLHMMGTLLKLILNMLVSILKTYE